MTHYTAFTDPVYGLHLYCLRGSAQDIRAGFRRLPTAALRTWARREIPLDHLHTAEGLMLHDTIEGKRTALICVLTRESVAEQRDTLLHEVLHAVDYIFAAKGVWRAGEQHGEPMTYFVTWMFRMARQGLGL